MTYRLVELFRTHKGKVTDKWTSYLEIYEQLFSDYKDKEVNILEIGVQNGGSLEIWAKYFTNAKNIIGCDIDERCSELTYDDERIKIVIGDAGDLLTAKRVREIVSSLDIIIDDGSHKSSDIIRAFANYYPLLNYGGIYIVEDLCCSYWKNFGGGLFEYYSAINFFKTLIDVINYEHWRLGKSRKWLLSKFAEKYNLSFDDSELATIRSVEFYNSLCVIRKECPEKTVIGPRIVVGEESIFGDLGEFRKRNNTSVLNIATEIELVLEKTVGA